METWAKTICELIDLWYTHGARGRELDTYVDCYERTMYGVTPTTRAIFGVGKPEAA